MHGVFTVLSVKKDSFLLYKEEYIRGESFHNIVMHLFYFFNFSELS